MGARDVTARATGATQAASMAHPVRLRACLGCLLFVGAVVGCDEGDPPPADAGADAGAPGSRADAGVPTGDAGGPEDAGPGGAPDAGARDDTGPGGPPTATRLTPDGSSWWDPEVIATDDGAFMTFQDGSGDIWLATIDPATGALEDGSLQTIATGGAPLLRTFNGPELGLDAQGLSVHFTQVGGDGAYQAARVQMVGGTPQLDVLTTGDEHFTPMASKDPTDASTRLVMLRRPPEWGAALWIDDAAPSVEHDLFVVDDRADSDVRWISGSHLLVTDGPLADTAREEVSVLDTDTGVVEVVSNGEGVFGNPYGWFAPDAGDRLQVVALTDDLALTVWGRDPGGWSRIATLPSPVAGLPYLGSPEPFVVEGRSYLSAVLADDADPRPGITEQQVWLFGLDGGPAWRCDDGAPGATRIDPEVLVLGDRIFVYYYTIDRTRSQVWVCATRVPA